MFVYFILVLFRILFVYFNLKYLVYIYYTSDALDKQQYGIFNFFCTELARNTRMATYRCYIKAFGPGFQCKVHLFFWVILDNSFQVHNLC